MSAESVDAGLVQFAGSGEAGAAPYLARRAARPGPYLRLGKPVLDRVLAVVALVVLAPLLAVTAAVVAAEFGRPVVFRQQRVGRGGRPFTVYKFRTMQHDRRYGGDGVYSTQQDRRLTHKSQDDPRHTALGRRLRKFSLDELPQLWNVVRGDMSLVGPRPELLQVVARYDDWQHRRHLVHPGLTGLWQVSARGRQPMHELTHIDLAYIDHLSLRGDLRILLATPLCLLSRKGS